MGLLLSRWKVDPYFKVFVLRGFGVKVEGLFVVVIIVNNGMLFSLLCFLSFGDNMESTWMMI